MTQNTQNVKPNMSDDKFGRLMLNAARRVTDEETLFTLGALLGVKAWQIRGIRYNKDRDGIMMAAREIMRKWQGRQEAPDEMKMRKALRDAFSHQDVDLRSDYIEVENGIYPEQADSSTAPSGPGGPLSASNVSSAPDNNASALARGNIEVADFDTPEVPGRSQYPIRKYERLGRAVIINNENFVDGKVRVGTNVDEKRIREVLKKIGLELTDESVDNPDGLKQPEMFVLKDKGIIEIRSILNKVSKMDHSDYACFCCFVLTHGNDKTLKTVDGLEMTMKELTDYFKGENCKSLIGKPKLFFIQACQGGGIDTGVRAEEADDDEPRSLPTEADVFIFFATPFGYKSWRHPEKGSRFIQCLCDALEQCYHDTDLLEMATVVNDMVAQMEAESGYKQVSMMTSTLRKKFYFKHQR